MKKVLFSLFSLFLIVGSLQAQDASKSYKTAKKLWGKLALTTDGRDALLADAKQNIDQATVIADGKYALGNKDLSKALQLKGEIYNDIANQEVIFKTTNASYVFENADAAIIAFQSFKGILDIPDLKKYQKKDAMAGFLTSAGNLLNVGKLIYGDGNYEAAMNSFSAVLDVREILRANGDNSLLETDEEYHEQIFLTALSAYSAQKYEKAEPFFQKLYDVSYDKPSVYEALYKISSEKGDDKSLAYLEKGRAKFPQDEGLRIAEINYYLAENKLDELVGKIKSAIAETPDNISLYSTLGNVYDNLYQREAAADNEAGAQEHFDNALVYYNQALEKDGENFFAIYNLGALYYNKAAFMTKELVVLEGDYSAKGLKAYNAKKDEVFAMFDKALPFFLKADTIDNSDAGTLTALKEIYAKKDDLAKSNGYKERLESIQASGN